MTAMTLPITTTTKPARDVVLYDGMCRFCRSQIAILKRLDLTGRLEFVSLHDPSVAVNFPEIPHDDLMREMYVVDRNGVAHGGARALRVLSRRLPLLWPLAIPLHVPFSQPMWNWLYRFIARNRYRIAGKCDEGGTCHLH
jgi:predicted DCC family thiol-disulfide oxidoreductase YuxK